MSLDGAGYKIIQDEISRHIEDTETSKVAHFIIADRYAHLDQRTQKVSAISFAGIVLSWFLSTQIFAIIESFNINIPTWISNLTEDFIPIALVSANVIFTTISVINNYGERSRSHREAAQRYHRLWRKCLNWRTEYPDSYTNELVAKVVSYREDLSELNYNSPDIEEWAWKKVDKELAKGGTDYEESAPNA